MTRDDAFALAGEVADLGFGCSVAIGVHPDMTPREQCSVHVHALRFEHVKLRDLIDLADQRGLELHLIGSDLRFVETTPAAAAAVNQREET